MTELNEFTIFISYSQLAVFHHSLKRPFNDWTARHNAQGFSWRPGSVSFLTIEEAGTHSVTAIVGVDEGELAPDAIRVIDVPFKVPPDGAVEIGSISDSKVLTLPSGMYQLRFEYYAGSNGRSPRVRLLFGRSDKPHFKMARADSELSPGADLLLTARPA